MPTSSSPPSPIELSKAFEIETGWEEPEALHDVLEHLREERPDADFRKIRYAYYVAEHAHAGQTRKTGEPYIIHPLAVTRILAELGMDDDTLCAGLLHDVLEDCEGYTAESIARVFGIDVAHLIDGVTKLSFKGREEQGTRAKTAQTAETLRKMLLAMARDFRVMVIKLADRLHNMQTLDARNPEARARIAQETLDVYAPLAARLGIYDMKWRLEDLAFKYLHPTEFARISERVARTRADREAELRQVIVQIKEKLQARGIKDAEVRGRPKHLYSIFNKIVGQNIPFEEVYDLLALRVIVDSVGDCYVALGVVHESFTPITSLFYDYIAKPKPNGYQSLHTKIVGPHGQPVEVQIRTRAMHAIAEYGVAAHWTYKEGQSQASEQAKLAALRERLLDWSSEAQASSDYLRAISTDLFAEQVFVFTPKGDVFDLPVGATPVDFAFRVHTALGMTLVGAKVNGTVHPLDRELHNGDVVEVITRSNASPSKDWLRFVKSAHTRTRLRAHFRKVTRETDAARGRELIEKELRSLGLEPKSVFGEDRLLKIAKEYDSVDSSAELLARVGSGLLTVQSVVNRLRGISTQPNAPRLPTIRPGKEGRLQHDGVLVQRARCCSPIPGDEIVGYVSRGRGIVLHRRICPNAQNAATTEPDRLLPYDWPVDGNGYEIPLRISAIDRTGLVSDITTVFAEAKANMTSISTMSRPNGTADINITLQVTGTEQLSHVMAKIANFSDILSSLRAFGKLNR